MKQTLASHSANSFTEIIVFHCHLLPDRKAISFCRKLQKKIEWKHSTLHAVRDTFHRIEEILNGNRKIERHV